VGLFLSGFSESFEIHPCSVPNACAFPLAYPAPKQVLLIQRAPLFCFKLIHPLADENRIASCLHFFLKKNKTKQVSSLLPTCLVLSSSPTPPQLESLDQQKLAGQLFSVFWYCCSLHSHDSSGAEPQQTKNRICRNRVRTRFS
jgi:predicted nucleic acid binding AN1-type Zn finger protein